MTISFQTIFSRFLGKINDLKFLSLPEGTANDFMLEWMYTVISKPYFRKLFKTFVVEKEAYRIQFTLRNSIDELYDTDFVIELISSGIAIAWLTPRVDSSENIFQAYGGSEEKFYAQANHLSKLQERLESLKTEHRKMVRDHGYAYEVISRGEGL